MSKPMVEKYEQMLAQDPASTVFVELARAYLDRGENDRAIATCQQGIVHHPNSVVGRVLWGKALINTGKAADAMKQFDLAVNIDRDNPHAYNLIGEALLRKGLYRSALPILRRASALQPNDGRIAQWLEQTKQALAGGPAPVLYDSTSVDQQALSAAGAPPAQRAVSAPVQTASVGSTPARGLPAAAAPPVPDGDEPDPFAAFQAANPQKVADPDAQPTVLMNAYTGGQPPAPPVPMGELPIIQGERQTQELPLIGATLDEPPDPFAGVASSAQEPDVVRGLTSTFDALSEGASAEVPHIAPPRPSNPVSTEPSVVVAEMTPPSSAAVAPVPAGMLDDVVSAQSELPTSELQLPGQQAIRNAQVVPAPAPRPPSSSGGLLDEIPDEVYETQSVKAAAPKGEFNTQATEAIAREYERELRAKLEVTKAKKTFWQQHGVKIAAIAGAVVILGGLGGSFLYTRVKNEGETLDTSTAKGLAAVNADTKEQYGAALKSLEQALKMDEGNPEALALFGYAHAMLFAEHGGQAADRTAAVDSFAQPAVRNGRPDLALVVDFLTADDGGRAAARQQLLGSGLEKGVVQAAAARQEVRRGAGAPEEGHRARPAQPPRAGRAGRLLHRLRRLRLGARDAQPRRGALEVPPRARHRSRRSAHRAGARAARGAVRSRRAPRLRRGARGTQGPLCVDAGPRPVTQRQARRGAQDAQRRPAALHPARVALRVGARSSSAQRGADGAGPEVV
jgi:tetratricopeptide (TPR) repeat protein